MTVVRLAGRVVGGIEGDEYRRTLKAGQVLQKPPAVAIDAGIVADLEAVGVRWVVLTLPDGEVLRARLALWLTRAFKVSRGYGLQLAVTLADLRSTSPAAPTSAGDPKGRGRKRGHVEGEDVGHVAAAPAQLRLCRTIGRACYLAHTGRKSPRRNAL